MKNTKILIVILIASFILSCSLITNPKSDMEQKIVFTEEIDKQTDIITINADGSSLQNLTKSNSNENSPRYTPDGHKIIYLQDGDIFSMNEDGTNKKNLTNTSYFEGDFSISPDSKSIAYISGTYYEPKSDIYIMNIDGSNKTRITYSQSPKLDISFLSDGDRIIYINTDSLFTVRSLFSIKIDGTEKTLLTPKDESFYEPTVSKNSNMICIFGRKALFLMDCSGDNFTKLIDYGFYPQFSNNGEYIFYNSISDSIVNISRINIDGTGVMNFNNGYTLFGEFSISPDDKKISFIKIEDKKHILYVMDTDGNNQKQIYKSGNDIWWPSFKPHN